jgi:hypothetical protein
MYWLIHARFSEKSEFFLHCSCSFHLISVLADANTSYKNAFMLVHFYLFGNKMLPPRTFLKIDTHRLTGNILRLSNKIKSIFWSGIVPVYYTVDRVRLTKLIATCKQFRKQRSGLFLQCAVPNLCHLLVVERARLLSGMSWRQLNLVVSACNIKPALRLNCFIFPGEVLQSPGWMKGNPYS